MEIGITAELQKKLGIKNLPEPSLSADPFFCWDVKLDKCGNKNALVMANVGTRFSIYATNLSRNIWVAFDAYMQNFIMNGNLLFSDLDVPDNGDMTRAKLLEPEIVDRYAEQAGEIVFTKTHGKKAVGQLTEASRLFWHLGEYYVPEQMVQMGMIVKANKTICHCIGHDDYITPCREYERELIERNIRLHPSTIE